MTRYSSTRLRKLMDESEYALRVASDSSSERVSRIVNSMLQDNRLYRLWESRHADLILPVAEQSRTKPQINALRLAEVRLIHRRALFRYLRAKQIRGELRRRLMRIFHSTRDYHDAVIAEHRQFILAESSRVSADHLIDVMHDGVSGSLLHQYEKTYARYFEMKCYVAGMGDSKCIDLVRMSMAETKARLQQVRHRIETEPPDSDCHSFDRQEITARSGRYPMVNYMVG